MITIRELQTSEDALAFRTLNEEWISHYFMLEAKDREQLQHPEILIEKGGHIYLAHLSERAVGCIALFPAPQEGVYELSKMAVAPSAQNAGVGRKLLLHAIAEAKRLEARSIFLGSNTKLTNAVRLYETTGFQHLPAHRIPQLGYTRANVFMELDLTAPSLPRNTPETHSR